MPSTNPTRPRRAARVAGVATLCVAALLVTLAVAARADIVHLKSGGKIEGRVIEKTATMIVVETASGTKMRIPRASVARIEKTRDVWAEYAERRRKVEKGDADGLFKLYEWCVANGMKGEAPRVLEEVLVADPDHAGARKVKGEVRIRGKWFTPEEAKKAGFKEHDGEWLTNDEFMKATGHVKLGDKWITEREHDRLYTKAKMEELLQMELVVENSEHFGVRSRFPRAHAKELLQLCEKAYDAFMKLIPYPKASLKKWRRIEIYAFAEHEEYQAFFDSFVWPKHYMTKEDLYLHYRDAGNCNLYYPRPMIVLRRSAALPKFKDQAALAVHNVGHVMVHRFRRDVYPPDWLEEAMGHWCEEQVFGVARIFTLMPGQMSHAELIVPGWRNSIKWRQQMGRLLVPGEAPPWKTLMRRPLGGINTKHQAKVYAVLRMIADKKPEALATFLEKATEHSWERVFAEATGWTPEEVDKQLADYIREKF